MFNFKIASELMAKLILAAAPTMPVPILRPDITPRNARRAERKSSARR